MTLNDFSGYTVVSITRVGIDEIHIAFVGAPKLILKDECCDLNAFVEVPRNVCVMHMERVE